MSNERSAVHELLSSELRKKIGNAVPLIGYKGESGSDNALLLHKDILNPSETMEISYEDILHTADAPESMLPGGGIIVWIKKDAPVKRRSELDTTVSEIITQRQVGRLSIYGRVFSPDLVSRIPLKCINRCIRCIPEVCMVMMPGQLQAGL